MGPTQHFRVAIVGAGPTGIGAAVGLARRGIHPVVLLERRESVGGIPALCRKKAEGIPTFVWWSRARVVFGEDYAEWLQDRLVAAGSEVWLGSQVIEVDRERRHLTVIGPQCRKTVLSADTVVLACGAREKTLADRGWIAGSRPAKVMFTKNLFDWIDRNGCAPMQTPAIIGSDLIAFSAAAKLSRSERENPRMFDSCSEASSSPLERLYFRRWCHPEWNVGVETASILGSDTASGLKVGDDPPITTDGVVVSGELVPNSELAWAAGFEPDLPSRKLAANSKFQISPDGWFVAGNLLGEFHGAERCYRNGLQAAASVAGYLGRDVARKS